MAKKFQTPPSLAEGVVCRTLTIPSDKYWLGIFNSALLEMLNPYLWEQVNETDLTIDDTIEYCESIINEYWATEGCITIPMFTATIETGTPISVTYDAETYAFHFVIPPGEQGIQGIPGIQGIQGIPGIPGINADAPNTVLPDLTADDKDEIFGGAMALVLHLEERVKDFLSALAIAANIIDAVSELVSAVPILNMLPFDEILALMADINSFGESAVNASLTPELREQLACDMFCIIVDNGGDMDTGTLESWRVENLDTLNPGQASIIGMSYLLSEKEHFDRYFLGLNDLNADWETLCTECAPPSGDWCYTFDFTANDGGWLADILSGQTLAQHSAGNGWYHATTGTTYRGRACWIHIDVNAYITHIDVVTAAANHQNVGFDYDSPFYPDGTGAIYGETAATFSADPEQTVTTLGIGVDKGGTTLSTVIERITLYGTGTNPFGADNCA